MQDERTGTEGAGIAEDATRRHHYRIDCDLPVRGRIEPGGIVFEGRLVNIGLGGASLELPMPVQVPAILHTEIELPVRDSDRTADARLVLPGTVVWNVADGDGAPYPVGVQFTELDDATRRALYLFVGRLLA